MPSFCARGLSSCGQTWGGGLLQEGNAARFLVSRDLETRIREPILFHNSAVGLLGGLPKTKALLNMMASPFTLSDVIALPPLSQALISRVFSNFSLLILSRRDLRVASASIVSIFLNKLRGLRSQPKSDCR